MKKWLVSLLSLDNENSEFIKNKLFLIAIIVVIMLVMALLRFNPLNGGEDNWIKDSRGVYVKHGNPFEIPEYVLEQQSIINQAFDLYKNKKAEGIVFSSQCLGSIDDYAVDIVHVPRTAEDDLTANQCPDFRNKVVSHFIELDKNGEIVRIV